MRRSIVSAARVGPPRAPLAPLVFARASSLPSPAFIAQFSTSPLSLAKKSKGGSASKPSKTKSPSDESALSPEEIARALEKTKGKMEKSVEWAKGVIYEGVERGRGRVSPALLDSIKVALPDGGGTVPLNAVASVTVKQMTLYVEVWDTEVGPFDSQNHLHSTDMPNRPTEVQRSQILKSIADTIEASKQQIRLARTEGLKTLGGRGEEGADEVQELTDGQSKELDELLSRAKKEFEKV
ncbi:ribosome recycling factor, partial [Tremellales sp. Uapishka_1]